MENVADVGNGARWIKADVTGGGHGQRAWLPNGNVIDDVGGGEGEVFTYLEGPMALEVPLGSKMRVSAPIDHGHVESKPRAAPLSMRQPITSQGLSISGPAWSGGFRGPWRLLFYSLRDGRGQP